MVCNCFLKLEFAILQTGQARSQIRFTDTCVPSHLVPAWSLTTRLCPRGSMALKAVSATRPGSWVAPPRASFPPVAPSPPHHLQPPSSVSPDSELTSSNPSDLLLPLSLIVTPETELAQYPSGQMENAVRGVNQLVLDLLAGQ